MLTTRTQAKPLVLGPDALYCAQSSLLCGEGGWLGRKGGARVAGWSVAWETMTNRTGKGYRM